MMSDLSQRLRAWTIDWNGAPMVDGEPPRDGMYCKDIRDAADEIESLTEAKRRALQIADERAKEANELRQQLVSARKALEIVALMIKGQMIEAAIVDATSMRSLGSVVKAALSDEKGQS